MFQPPGLPYTAFISYANSEQDFVARLQSALHHFAKPLYRLRAIRTFRDKTNLPATIGLRKEVLSALDQSQFLVLIASKAAAASNWVNLEVEYWLQTKNKDSIVLVLLTGEIHWDRDKQRIDSNALPKCLFAHLQDQPAWADLTWASSPDQLSRRDERFNNAIAMISAQLRGRPKDELYGEDRRQHRLSRLVAFGALLILSIATVLALVFALRASRERMIAEALRARAEKAATVATAEQLATQAESLRTEVPTSPPLSALLALESLRSNPTPEGLEVLRRAVELLPKRLAVHNLEQHTGLVIFSPNGKYYASAGCPTLAQAIIAGGDETARVWDNSNNRPLWNYEHNAAVMAMAFSPNDRMLATALFDHTVQIWDLPEGKEGSYILHRRPAVAVAFSPDSSFVVSVGRDEELRVWDPTNGRIRYVLDLRRGPPESTDFATRLEQVTSKGAPKLAVSPNGELIALSPPTTGTYVIAAATGRVLYRIRHDLPSKNAILSNFAYRLVDFSRDRKLLALSDYDRQILLVDVGSGKIIRKLQHSSFPTSVNFLGDGSHLVTGDRDGFVRLWDARDGRALLTIEAQASVNDISVNSDGTMIAIACGDQTARVWSISDARETARIVSGDIVTSVAISPDGGRIAVTGGNSVSIWESKGFGEVAQFRHSQPLAAMRFGPRNEKLMVTVTSAQTREYFLRRQLMGQSSSAQVQPSQQIAYIWDLQTGRQVKAITHGEAITGVALSSDEKRVVTSGSDHTVRVFGFDGTELLRLPHEDIVTKIALSPDSNVLATSSGIISLKDSFNDTGKHTFLRLWDINRGTEFRKLELTESLQSLSFSPDGSFLIAIGESNGVLRRTSDLSEVLRLPNEGTLRSVIFSPTGDVMATASVHGNNSNKEVEERIVQFWKKWNSPKPEQILRVSLREPIAALEFDPSGSNVLIAAGKDVQIWSLSRGVRTTTLQHEDTVADAVFSQDARYVATGASDRSARVWDSINGRELARFVHPETVIAVQFRAQGNELLAAGADGVVRVWRWKPEELMKEACARVMRNLSEDEIRRYVPNESPHKTCPNLP